MCRQGEAGSRHRQTGGPVASAMARCRGRRFWLCLVSGLMGGALLISLTSQPSSLPIWYGLNTAAIKPDRHVSLAAPADQPSVQSWQSAPENTNVTGRDAGGRGNKALPSSPTKNVEEAPFYSRATSMEETKLKEFNIVDNPAYKPDPTAFLAESLSSILQAGATKLREVHAKMWNSTTGQQKPGPTSPSDVAGSTNILKQTDTAKQTEPASNDVSSPVLGQNQPSSSSGTNMNGTSDQKPKPPREVLVHFDLKGAPPRVRYLKKIIRLVARLGATGLLIEWEDKFPYTGELAAVVAGSAYSLSEVEEILAEAAANKLKVMPLVQTFGHLEFVLKLEQFAALREDPSTPQALCPSRNESARLVEQLIDQVMAVHKGADRVHIGSDEVFVLGRCDLCRRRGRDDLILGQVTRTARYLRKKYNATAVMWEDMLRNVMPGKVEEYHAGNLVEPMMWWYTPNVKRYVAPIVWRRAEGRFPYVWGAGAYKGAFGSALFVAPVDRHVQNNLDWVELLSEEDPRLRGGVRGLVLTGWSRYDHFATMAELLPAAIPSLAFSLAAVREAELNPTTINEAMNALDCPRGRRPHKDQLDMPYMYRPMSICQFPGQPFYMFTKKYNITSVRIRQYLLGELETGQSSAWLGNYNLRHNFTSRLRIDEELPRIRRLWSDASRLMIEGYHTLRDIYKLDVVLEWLEHRVYPFLEALDDLTEKMNELAKVETFPVRPARQYPKKFIHYMDEMVNDWRIRT